MNSDNVSDLLDDFIIWQSDENTYCSDQLSFTKMLGDASEKQFYRVTRRNLHLCISPKSKKILTESWIIIKFPCETKALSDEIFLYDHVPKTTTPKDLFLEINYFLHENLPNIPQILAEKNNLVLMQDVGTTSLYNLLTTQPVNEISIGNCYEELIHWIAKLQQIGKKLPSKHLLKLRQFNNDAIKSELRELVYYLPLLSQCTNECTIEQSLMLKLFSDHIGNIIDPNEQLVVIHRDFQCKNIMYCDNKPYVIDNQDMCQGPMLYDLASLLYDVNAQLSSLERQRLAKIYWEHYYKNEMSYVKFLSKLRITALQRILKSLGRHAKLYYQSKRIISLQTIKKVIPVIELLMQQTEIKCGMLLLRFIRQHTDKVIINI